MFYKCPSRSNQYDCREQNSSFQPKTKPISLQKSRIESKLTNVLCSTGLPKLQYVLLLFQYNENEWNATSAIKILRKRELP